MKQDKAAFLHILQVLKSARVKTQSLLACLFDFMTKYVCHMPSDDCVHVTVRVINTFTFQHQISKLKCI